MHSRLLVSGLPNSLPSLPRSPAPPCLPCVEGWQRAAPHSSEFPPTTAPLQPLHMDVWGPTPVSGTDQERYFLLVVDDYTRYTTVFPLRRKADVSGVLIRWIRATRHQLRERFRRDLLILRLHYDKGETSPTLRWTGKVGDASVFWVWGVLSLVRDAKASQLSSRTLRCVFLGFPTDAPPWQFYHPRSRRVFSSHDVTFGESVCFYRLHLHASHPVDPPPLDEPVEISSDSSDPAEGGDPAADDTTTTRRSPRSETPLGFLPRPSLQPATLDSGGADSGGAASPSGGGAVGASARGPRAGQPQQPGLLETILPQQIRAWIIRRGNPGGGGYSAASTGAASPGGTAGARGAGGTAQGAAGAGGAGAASPGGTAGAGGAGGTAGVAAGAGGGAGAASPGGAVGAGGAGGTAGGAGGAAGAGAAGAASPGGTFGAGGSGGPVRGAEAASLGGTAGARGAEAASPGGAAGARGAGGAVGSAGGAAGAGESLTERREPETRASTPERRETETRASIPARVCRVRCPRAPAILGTHDMTLRPSSVPHRVVLPSPPASSLLNIADPPSDLARASSLTVTRFLATVVTDPTFSSPAASAIVAKLVDFVATYRLDYLASLVSNPNPACPPSVGGEVTLGCDVLEDMQEELECLAATVPHLVAVLLAREGDPDALDIPTPHSYREAISGEYSSQWLTAKDAEMASWKSTCTYVDEVPPPGANIISGMWIFMVKRPPGSPPAFSQREGVDFFQTFSPTPKMTTLRVLQHVAARRDYELHSLDFSTAFLQGSLHEAIWLRRPPGFTGSFPKATQRSLRRLVYGLRQAPREWHDTLRTTLAALGFAPSTADPLPFLSTDTTLQPFYVLVYVDDLVFTTADMEALALVKAELQERHTCTDLGPLPLRLPALLATAHSSIY
ncbi:unnamed protein product [Closterium sp. NIES-53]